MNERSWITKAECLAFHSMLIATFGGGDGMRDEGQLDVSLNRPHRQFHYEDPSIFELAATYASGIVNSHPFIDGNKRTGFMTAALFFESNGYQLEATEETAALQILALAGYQLSDDALTQWLEANCTKIKT
jgi:death-on-curing protein